MVSVVDRVAKKRKVAVVGSGISALSAAWFLSQKHQVVLFEKQPRLGGHTNTIEVKEGDKTIPVDTGFIVFNRPNYHHLTAMFKHLRVATQDTEMSFAVSIDEGDVEYSGTDINGLFAQRSNLFSVSHWKMIFEILRFNKTAKADLKSTKALDESLGDYLLENRFSDKMRDHYLLPMAAAIWSCPVDTMLKFPTRSFLQFFENHGLLNVEDRPQWETVVNGSKTYINEVLQNSNFEYRLADGVSKVTKADKGLILTTESGHTEHFDEVVFGSHADETFKVLDASLQADFALLQNFAYQENIAYLHTDKNLMPKRQKAWSSWNYLRDMQQPENAVAVTYWMNLLQNLQAEKDYFVTLNPITPPQPKDVIRKIVYEHPVFDQAAMQAQTSLHELQGQNNIWLCGSYFGYGFHEDGLNSSVNLAKLWGINLPWQSDENKVVSLEKTSADAVEKTLSEKKVG